MLRAIVLASLLLVSSLGFAQIQDDPGIFVPHSVKNVDVDALAERLDQFAYEMAYSESASTTTMLDYDYANIVLWSAEVRDHVERVYAAPRANWGQSRGRMYQITFRMDGVDEASVNNLEIRYAISFLYGILSNMTRSESADISNGLFVQDYTTIIGGLDKFDELLAGYDPSTRTPKPQSSSFGSAFNSSTGK